MSHMIHYDMIHMICEFKSINFINDKIVKKDVMSKIKWRKRCHVNDKIMKKRYHISMTIPIPGCLYQWQRDSHPPVDNDVTSHQVPDTICTYMSHQVHNFKISNFKIFNFKISRLTRSVNFKISLSLICSTVCVCFHLWHWSKLYCYGADVCDWWLFIFFWLILLKF